MNDMFRKIIKGLVIFLALSVIISIGLGVQTAYNTDTPVKILLTDLKNNHYNPQKVMEHIKVTPQKKHYELLSKKEDMPKNQEHVYILFKYGCPHCEKMTKYLSKKYPSLKNTQIPVSFVNTETELGKKLIKTYNVTNVPTLIYIQHDNQTDYAVFNLTDEKGNLNIDVLTQYLRSVDSKTVK